MRVVLVHGWNVADGGLGTVGSLEAPLRELGHEVVRYGYGRVRGYLQTKRRSRDAAMVLAPRLRAGDAVVGHSNGCRVALEVSQRVCCDLGPMVWLHPALDRDQVPSCHVPRLLVVHSPRDLAVAVARWIPLSSWGTMGRDGYRPRPDNTMGPDPRVRNLRTDDRHSSWNRTPWRTARVVHDFLEEV